MTVMKFAGYVIKKLFRKPSTLMYPIRPRKFFEKTRGHIDIDINTCIFCGMCQRKCPSNAIGVDKGTGVWDIERLKCIQCNCCVEVCPKKCLSMRNSYTSPSLGNVKDVFHARVSDNSQNNKNS